MTKTPQRRFKDSIYGQFARIGRALAAPQRIELLDLLCQGPRTVEVLAAQAGLPVANASQHLRVLHAARLVETEKRGLYVEYRLADEKVCRFFHALRDLAESRLTEVEYFAREYFDERGPLEAVAAAELRRRMRRGDVTVIDVRPVEEFRVAHVAGAVSVPLPDLARRLADLPRDRDVVAYCRGPYCVMAVEAVQALRARGYRAHWMKQSVTDWRAAGGRVAAGEN